VLFRSGLDPFRLLTDSVSAQPAYAGLDVWPTVSLSVSVSALLRNSKNAGKCLKRAQNQKSLKILKKVYKKNFKFFLVLCAIWMISSIFRVFQNFENLHQNYPLPYTCQTRFMAWFVSDVPWH
jgi:hypothetical protein